MPFNEDGSRKEGPLYKKSGFKMKGSPMQRNFGIGSPLKQDETRSDTTATGYAYMSNPPKYGVHIEKGGKKRLDILSSDEMKKFMEANPSGTTKGKTYKKDRSGAGARSFDAAFSAASKAGKKTFTWKGKSYSTKKK